MKICPLCHTKFEDSAEFCPKCLAELDDLEEVERAEAGKIPKSFWISVVWVLGFIVVMYLFYLFLYGDLDLSAIRPQ